MIVAFSGLARRTAASNERHEMDWPVNGRTTRRTGRGWPRAARLPWGGSQKPAASPIARQTTAIAMTSPALISLGDETTRPRAESAGYEETARHLLERLSERGWAAGRL